MTVPCTYGDESRRMSTTPFRNAEHGRRETRNEAIEGFG
jgi:hypothetical protein